MPSYYVADPRGRRGATDIPVYRTLREDDLVSRDSSNYQGTRYDDDRDGRSAEMIVARPSRRSYDMPRAQGRNHREGALVVRPRQARSRSRPRFREDDSVIDDNETIIPDDGKTYVRSRARGAGQRPAHAFVRNKSRRRRGSSVNAHDLERKTSRKDKQFRERRNNLENEEAVMLIRAKSRERDRHEPVSKGYGSDREQYRERREPEYARERTRKPRIEIPSDDDRDIVVVPRSSRRRNTVDETSSRYEEDSRSARSTRTAGREAQTSRSTRTRSPEKDVGDYVKQVPTYVRSGEKYYRQGRGLVEGMKNLRT